MRIEVAVLSVRAAGQARWAGHRGRVCRSPSQGHIPSYSKASIFALEAFS